MAQATFLEICQRTALECGVHHSTTQLPSTVVNQTGELRRIVDWVSEAWFTLQNLHNDWRFLRREASFAVVDGQAEYTIVQCGLTAATFGRWLKGTFRNYVTATGLVSEIQMGDLSYDVWRDTYKFNANRTAKGRPVDIAILPNDGLGLGLSPLAGYTILGDYYLAPVRLTADSDIPSLPEKHSYMLIVYEAMKAYGLYESAAEVLARGDREGNKLLRRLELDQLPQPSLAGSAR